MIYELFLDGLSFTRIKNALESRGKLTAMGNQIWSESNIKSILKNEKYVGDVLLQKTFTADCITKKVVKNNGERPMYLVTKHHAPIIDRDTFNRVQQELARRSSKRKISDKTTTEQGKYSSKYALSELLICGNCGTPYRRCTWTAGGKKQIVWRCISRLDHGKKYCSESPTIHEDKLHRAILKAVNEYLGCGDEIAKILKANIGSVLECKNQQEILNLEQRLKDLDKARNDLISLITGGGCDENMLDCEFEKIHAEEQEINEKLSELRKNAEISTDTQNKIDSAMEMLAHENFQVEVFDNVIVRKLIDCVKVLSKEKLLIVFKGGVEVKAQMEK